MTKQIIQGTLPSFTGYSGPWVIEKMKKIFVKPTQGQVLTVPKANTILAPIYIYPFQSLEDIDNGVSGYSKEYLSRNVTTSTLSFLGSKLYSSHVNSVLGFKNTFAYKVIAGNTRKLGVLRLSIPTYPAEQRLRDFYLDVNSQVASQENSLNLFIHSKTTVSKKVDEPELRFPGFTEPWVKDQVGNIFDKLTNGKRKKVNELSEIKTEEFKYPVYSAQTTNNGIMGYYNEYLFENCITWTREGYAGQVNFREGEFYCIDTCGVILSNKGYSNKFFAENLSRKAFRYVLQAGIPKLYPDSLSIITLTFPRDLNEQQKIGNFFKDVDDKITSLQNALSKIKELKQSLIYKLLVVKNDIQPELRFPEFISPWIDNKTEDIFDEVKTGKTGLISHLSKEKTEVFRYPVYTSQTTNNGISAYNDTYSNEDSITWTVDGYAGKVVYREGKFYINHHCGILISNKGYSNRAMAEILDLVAYKHATRTGIPKVSTTAFKKIIITYPSEIAEQQKLNDLFKDLDNLASQLELNIEHHKTLKQALLQRMFV